MKMISDMDMYYADRYAKDSRIPMWMKAERIDYCEITAADHRTGSIFHSLFHKEAK